MNRDTFPGMLSHVRTYAEGPPGNNAHAGSARSLRSIRSHTRRRLHEPRPAVSPETRARIGQWKAEIKAAGLAGYISKGGDKYLHELLTIPSIARGNYCLYSDAEMGQRINIKGRTIRQHRKDADIHGLVEVLGHGKDRKPCMVRPILRDGSPVFPDPKSAGKSATFSRLTRQISAADLLLTDTLKTEYPPLPPIAPDALGEGGRAVDQEDQPTKSAESTNEEPAKPEPKPAEPPGSREGPASHQTRKPHQRAPQPLRRLPSQGLMRSSQPSPSCPSSNSGWRWGEPDPRGDARAQWGKLSATDKAAIQDRLGRPRSWAADMWAGKWLECRVWEEAAPVDRPAQVFIREGTAEWRAWQRHLGRDMPVDNRGGWHFPSRLPPLTDAEASASTEIVRLRLRATKKHLVGSP